MHSYLSETPLKELSHNTKEYGHRPRSPRGRKAYKPRDAAWFPKGIVHDTAIDYPSAMQPSARYLGLGRPEPACVVVTLYRYPLHTCYHLPHDPGYGLPACFRVTHLRAPPTHLLPSPHNPEVRTRGWIYGRQVSIKMISNH
jgi:hypothetical protein